jgi:hypothetical protein
MQSESKLYMAHLSILKSLLFISLVSLALACSKQEPTASPLPSITFKAIHKVTLATNATSARRDSVVVSISYTDGDGDLGEDPRDSARLKQVYSNQTWGNFQIRAFQLAGNRFEEITTLPATKLFVDLGSAPNRPQMGTLAYKQFFPYTGTYRLVPVKFQVRMCDRNLNESNIVETDTVSLPISL